MDTRPEHYFEASRERLETARRLYEEGRDYVAATYFAGLALESMLRAFYPSEALFDARHDLGRIAQPGFNNVIGERSREPVGAAISEAMVRWRNDIRYYSAPLLNAFVRTINRDHPTWRLSRGAEKNIAKENCRRLLEAAATVINVGVLKWKSFAND